MRDPSARKQMRPATPFQIVIAGHIRSKNGVASLAYVPAIPLRHARIVRQYYLYILASRPGGALYVGVTNDLVRRVHEHKNGTIQGFTTRYGIDRLVYYEVHDTAYAAIQREKNIKHWPRVWKTRLILQSNPTWRDLYGEIVC
jgi:putative endonuclease